MIKVARTIVLCAVVSASLAGLPARAASPAPTVDQIVAKYVAARGGLDKIQSVQSLRQKGHVTAGPDKHGVVTRELKRPSNTRVEFKVQGVTAVFVSDGKRGWKVDPFQGDAKLEPLSDQVVAEAAEQGDFEGPIANWKAKGNKVELAGQEKVAGHPAYKLKVTLASGAVRYDYIDAKSSYLVRTDSTRQVRGRPVQIHTTFGDFKKTSGLLFPGWVEIAAEGRPNVMRIEVESVEVNPSLSDARFAMPATMPPAAK
jgi:outer membrane lipoprotein-sorting protein